MLNNNEPLTEDDQTLFEVIKNEDVIVIINKTDLEQRLDVSELREMIMICHIQTSMLKQEGIDELKYKLKIYSLVKYKIKI